MARNSSAGRTCARRLYSLYRHSNENGAPPPYRQTARAAAAAATRERILEVATEHFLARYYDDVTLAAIAKEAGVSQQTVINHFASKEGLLEAAADRSTPSASGRPGLRPRRERRRGLRALRRRGRSACSRS